MKELGSENGIPYIHSTMCIHSTMAKSWLYQGIQSERKNILFVPENIFHFQVFAWKDQGVLKLDVWLWIYSFSTNIAYKNLSVSVWNFHHVKHPTTSSLLQTLRTFLSCCFEQVTCQLSLMPPKFWSCMTQQNSTEAAFFPLGFRQFSAWMLIPGKAVKVSGWH